MTADEMILKIRNGGMDRDHAIKFLYDSFYRPFSGFFVYRGMAPQDASDLFQEVVIKINKGAEKFTSEMKGEAWLWQIARNAFYDDQRRKKRQPLDNTVHTSEEGSDNILDIVEAPLEICDEDNVDHCFEQGLKIFEKEEADRVWALMMQMDGKSVADISAQIGRSVGATKEYLSQCRKKLAPYVQHCLELLPA